MSLSGMRIVIVGAGVGGLTLALRLRRRRQTLLLIKVSLYHIPHDGSRKLSMLTMFKKSHHDNFGSPARRKPFKPGVILEIPARGGTLIVIGCELG